MNSKNFYPNFKGSLEENNLILQRLDQCQLCEILQHMWSDYETEWEIFAFFVQLVILITFNVLTIANVLNII